MDYTLQITTAWNQARDSIIEVGRLLVEAKANLEHGQFTKMIEHELPFGKSTAQSLMAIFKDKRLSESQFIQLLPNSWATLHELTKLNDNADSTAKCIIERAI